MCLGAKDDVVTVCIFEKRLRLERVKIFSRDHTAFTRLLNGNYEVVSILSGIASASV